MITDFHSHILPGIDDGSRTVEESIAMLRAEAEQGIKRVVATPHFYPQQDSPESFLRKREIAESALREAMAEYDDLPELIVGAEVYFFRGICDSEEINTLTFGKNRCILLEMPNTSWTDAYYREIEAIYERQGITPIIAHVDRYLNPLCDFGIPRRLSELPVLVQANASFFLHRSTARMAHRMLRDGHIHFLGSDCHNLTLRPPNMAQALTAIQRKHGMAPIEQIAQNEASVFQELVF